MDVHGGAFKWALKRSPQHQRSFWVGSVLLTAVSTLTATLITNWPLSPQIKRTKTGARFMLPMPWDRRALDVVVVLLIAVAGLLLTVFSFALVRAPYEQRNRLRTRITELASAPTLDSRPRDLSPQTREALSDAYTQVSERFADFSAAAERQLKYPSLGGSAARSAEAELRRSITRSEAIISEHLGRAEAVSAGRELGRDRSGRPLAAPLGILGTSAETTWSKAAGHLAWIHNKLA